MSALPGPKDHSFGLSLARRMQADLLQFSQEMAAEFGDLAFFRVGPLKICLLNHPDLIHEALSTRVKSFPKFERPIRQLAKMDGQAITVTEGDAWLRGRRVVQPAFQASRLDPYGEIVVEATRDLASRWQAEETVDAAEEFRRLTLQTMTRTLFGARGETSRGDRKCLPRVFGHHQPRALSAFRFAGLAAVAKQDPQASRSPASARLRSPRS
jgi:cytochrome P450